MRRTEVRLVVVAFIGMIIFGVGGISEFNGALYLMYGGFGVAIIAILGVAGLDLLTARRWYLRQGRKVQKMVLQGLNSAFASILLGGIYSIMDRYWVPEPIPLVLVGIIGMLIPLSMMAGLILLMLAYYNSRKRS